MSGFIGIDGCRGGWIAVAIAPSGQRSVAIVPRIGDVAGLADGRAMIDIPIGLPERGYRACDHAARSLLAAARSRVFLGARRPLLGFLPEDFLGATLAERGNAHAAANAWAKAAGEPGLSVQLWNILPKIREVDRLVAPALQDRLREAHPELVFQRLAGGDALPAKKSPEGRHRRRDLVAAAGFDAIDAWLGRLKGTGAGADDLLDACALALAAREPGGVLRCPATDARGLRMEIWY
jgi:predicted RNase H-like nuclease